MTITLTDNYELSRETLLAIIQDAMTHGFAYYTITCSLDDRTLEIKIEHIPTKDNLPKADGK